jgi:hypothetical protein
MSRKGASQAHPIFGFLGKTSNAQRSFNLIDRKLRCILVSPVFRARIAHRRNPLKYLIRSLAGHCTVHLEHDAKIKLDMLAPSAKAMSSLHLVFASPADAGSRF